MRRFDSPPGARESARLRGLLRRPAPEAARGLIGQVLVRLGAGEPKAVRIVETEAYLGVGDPVGQLPSNWQPVSDQQEFHRTIDNQR